MKTKNQTRPRPLTSCMLGLALGALLLTSCNSPTGRGTATGAALGAAGGVAYDRVQKGHWSADGDMARRAAIGGGIGAGAGAIIGSQAGQAQPQYQQPYRQQQYQQPQYQQPQYQQPYYQQPQYRAPY